MALTGAERVKNHRERKKLIKAAMAKMATAREFDVDARVVRGRLQVTWDFSPACYQIVEELAESLGMDVDRLLDGYMKQSIKNVKRSVRN